MKARRALRSTSPGRARSGRGIWPRRSRRSLALVQSPARMNAAQSLDLARRQGSARRLDSSHTRAWGLRPDASGGRSASLPLDSTRRRASKKRAASTSRGRKRRRRRLAAAARPSGCPAEVNDAAGDLAAAGEAARARQPRGPRVARPASPSREYKPREYKPRGTESDARPPRKTFSKPGTFGRKREGFGGRGFGGESGKRAYRKFDAPRDRAARPFSSDRPARPFSPDRPARPARAEGIGGTARKPEGDFKPRKFAGKLFDKPGGFAGKKPYGKSTGKPGGFAGKKPFGKAGASFAGKPSSTFAKFAGSRKPFGKRAPARKFKPKENGAD